VRLSELQYDLPAERIAQRPVEPRDSSRLLVLDRARGRIEHRAFRDVGEYLSPGDCLVLNDTRVIPARFFCRRTTGGRVEGLFLHEDARGWLVLLKPTRRLRIGQRLRCDGSDTHLMLDERRERGEWLVRPEPVVAPLALLERIGQTPLPPYIRRGAAGPDPADAERYQTVYADRPGAVAAPTAGLHFTAGLLARLVQAGVRAARVTLHVGVGTFAPIEVEDLSQHRMHAEWSEATPAALTTIRDTRAAGGRVVAVGTTSVRVLESLPEDAMERHHPTGDRPRPGPSGPGVFASLREPAASDRSEAGLSGWTDIFIYPPYRFRHVDRLITNFHLPGSTLLALAMAFASPELIRTAYQAAIERRYRFYSYGDAMLIL